MRNEKTKKREELIFTVLKSPYEEKEKKSIEKLHEEYTNDPMSVMEIGDVAYYKRN